MKAYTQRNCQFECIENTTLDLCNCVPFYMPRNDSTPICGEGNIWCYVHIETEVWEKAETSAVNVCNCLPACTSISYAAEISQTKYEFHIYEKAFGFPASLDGYSFFFYSS